VLDTTGTGSSRESGSKRSERALAVRERWFGTLLAHSRDLIAVVDDKARIVYANPAAERMLGFVPEEHLGQNALGLIHPEDRDATTAKFLGVTDRTRDSSAAVFRLQTASGEWRVVEATATNCLDDPAIKGIVVNAHDVTEQTALSRVIRTLSQANEVLVHAADESGLLSDTCRAIVTSGEYLLAWVGYAEHDEVRSVRPVASAGRTEYLDGLHVTWGDDESGCGPTGRSIRTRQVQLLNDTHRSKKFAPWRKIADEHGLRASCALPLVVGDDTVGALMIYAGDPGAFGPAELAVLSEMADDVSYGIGRIRDAGRLVRNEALLREAERLAHVGHWEWDLASGRVEFMADEVFAIHGITPAQWKGSFPALMDFVHPEDRPSFEKAVARTLADGRAELEHRILRPDGSVCFVRTRTEAIANESGQPVRIVGTCQDITDQRSAELEIEHSRKFLSAITDNMAEGMLATDGEGTVTYVNAAAERLLGWRASELLGRSAHATYHFRHADGSAYPAEECPLSSVAELRESLYVEHDTFVRKDGTLLPVAYSASPLRTGHVDGSVVVFADVSEQVAERLRVDRELEKLSWVGRIRDALDQDRFVLYAQPILDLATNAVVQNELLIRMLSPKGEIVPPDRFLPTAEEYGLISEIDRWVIGETARLAAQGHRVEFNLSAKSVVSPNMVAVIRDAFEFHGAPPGLVVCEITETALMRDTVAAEAFVQGLNDLGCQVALDDFGAGYGGFAYLKRLPVSYLKIDQEFVRDLAQEASSRHVVSAVVSLAKAFSLITVAEAAEDEATVELLRQLGVDRVQGFVIARPHPVDEVLGVGTSR
jgi:PAS domain S-box-containing protein